MIRPENKNGYTLLEVMVALLIVAMSLGAIFQNLSLSKRISLKSERAFKAVRLANNIFHDLETINIVVRGETIEENIPEEENRYYKFYSEPLVLDQISDDKTPLEIEGLKKITLCILHDENGKKQSFCFVKWRKP